MDLLGRLVDYVLGMGVLVNLDRDTSVPAWIFMHIVAGIGVGMLYMGLHIVLPYPYLLIPLSLSCLAYAT